MAYVSLQCLDKVGHVTVQKSHISSPQRFFLCWPSGTHINPQWSQKIDLLSKLNKTKGSSTSSNSAYLLLSLTFSFYHYFCSDDSDTSGVNLVCKISSWPMRDVTNTIEWLRERTEHLNIFLFSTHHSIVFYFRCSVYWWKGSVRF